MRVFSGDSEKAPPPSLGFIILLGALTASGAMAIDLYLPALPAIARDFGVPVGAVQASLSAYFVGMAVGQLVYGPVSDRIGRRKPLIFGACLALSGAVLSGFAMSPEWLVVSRLLESLGGCAGVVVARAVVSDRYGMVESAKIFSTLMLVLGVAPLLAPTLGALLLDAWGWRTIFIVLAAFAATQAAAVFFFLDETRSSTLAAASRGEKVWRSYLACFSDRRIGGLVLVGAFNGGAFFTYLAASAELFISHFGTSPQLFAIIFGVNAGGLIGGSQFNRYLLRRHTPAGIVSGACMGALAGSGVLLAAVLADVATLWVTTAILFAIMSTYGLVAGNVMAMALSRMPARGGAISALNGASAFGVGGISSAVAAFLPFDVPLRVSLVLFAGLCGAVIILRTMVRVQEWR